MESDIGPLLCRLFPLVCEAAKKYVGITRKGHIFEDEIAKSVYIFANESGFLSHPPRTTLNYDTRSGNRHQFDASFRKRDRVFLIECKNTKQAAKDYLYYFNAKIMDYVDCHRNQDLLFSGIFVSVVSVAESAMKYALAYGIRVVDSVTPPPELIFQCGDEVLCSLSSDLMKKIISVQEDSEYHIDRLLDEYRYLCSRWRDIHDAE